MTPCTPRRIDPLFVSDTPGFNAWRPARESESICVWDPQVIWAEREAYVRTVLGGMDRDAVAAYLAVTLREAA